MTRRTAAAWFLVAVLVTATGCDRLTGGDADGAAPDAGASLNPASTEATGATAAPVALNRSAWYAGLRFDLGTATARPGGDGTLPAVSIDTVIEATGAGGGNTRNVRFHLELGGESIDGAVQDAPILDGLEKVTTALVFQTPKPVTDLSGAVLVIGDSERVQAEVRFDGSPGTDNKPATAFAGPRTVPFKDIKLTVSGCELRSDHKDRSEQAAKGHRMITCTLKVQNVSGGYFHIYDAEFQLKAPDGATTGATYGSMTQGIDNTKTTKDILLGWEIPWPATGAYALSVAQLDKPEESVSTAKNRVDIPLTLG